MIDIKCIKIALEIFIFSNVVECLKRRNTYSILSCLELWKLGNFPLKLLQLNLQLIPKVENKEKIKTTKNSGTTQIYNYDTAQDY